MDGASADAELRRALGGSGETTMDQIERVKNRRKELKTERDKLSAEMKVAEKKKARLTTKLANLSRADLIEGIIICSGVAAAKAKGKAKAKAKAKATGVVIAATAVG
jgi:DNA-binding protein H-NS